MYCIIHIYVRVQMKRITIIIRMYIYIILKTIIAIGGGWRGKTKCALIHVVVVVVVVVVGSFFIIRTYDTYIMLRSGKGKID